MCGLPGNIHHTSAQSYLHFLHAPMTLIVHKQWSVLRIYQQQHAPQKKKSNTVLQSRGSNNTFRQLDTSQLGEVMDAMSHITTTLFSQPPQPWGPTTTIEEQWWLPTNINTWWWWPPMASNDWSQGPTTGTINKCPWRPTPGPQDWWMATRVHHQINRWQWAPVRIRPIPLIGGKDKGNGSCMYHQ